MSRLAIAFVALGLLAASVAWLYLGRIPPDPREATDNLADLNGDIVPLLRGLPGVAYVESKVCPGRPTCRIIQFRDYHAIDVPTDPQLAEDVEAAQGEQLQALGVLIDRNGLTRIGSEGLAPADMRNWLRKVEALQKIDREEVPRLKELLAETFMVKLKAELRGMLSDHQGRLRELGAAGRLLLAGKIESVDPIENAEALEAARPRDGQIDQRKQRARDDAIVRIVTARSPMAVLVLGAAHDLSDSVRRLAPGCEYITVTTPTVGKLCR